MFKKKIFGCLKNRSKTPAGASRVTRCEILDAAVIMTQVCTPPSQMFLKFGCCFATGCVTFKTTDYCLDADHSIKLMAEIE